jgi:hypothetical protein
MSADKMSEVRGGLASVGVGGLVALCMLACASNKPAERPDQQMINYQTDYRDLTRKKIADGDTYGAMMTMHYMAEYMEAKMKQSEEADEVIRDDFKESWEQVSSALEEEIDAALEAGNPYLAQEIADAVIYREPEGRVKTAYMREERLAAVFPQTGKWRAKMLSKIRESRDLKAEAAQAQREGHHALALCLSAGLKDSATQQRATQDFMNRWVKKPLRLVTSGDDAGLMWAAMPYIEERYQLVDEAPNTLTLTFSDLTFGEVDEMVEVTEETRGDSEVYTKEARAAGAEFDAYVRAKAEYDRWARVTCDKEAACKDAPKNLQRARAALQKKIGSSALITERSREVSTAQERRAGQRVRVRITMTYEEGGKTKKQTMEPSAIAVSSQDTPSREAAIKKLHSNFIHNSLSTVFRTVGDASAELSSRISVAETDARRVDAELGRFFTKRLNAEPVEADETFVVRELCEINAKDDDALWRVMGF